MDLCKDCPQWCVHDEMARSAERARVVTDLARVTAERDAALAEVEAMRDLLGESWPCGCGHPVCKRCRYDGEVRDALRARKVGG